MLSTSANLPDIVFAGKARTWAVNLGRRENRSHQRPEQTRLSRSTMPMILSVLNCGRRLKTKGSNSDIVAEPTETEASSSGDYSPS